MTKLEVGRGVAYLYVETATTMFSGYVFWLILSKITSAGIIGTSSAVVSFAAIFTTVITLGVPNGLNRSLGRSFSDQKLEDAKVGVLASLVLVLIGIVASSAVIFAAGNWIIDTFRIDYNLIILSVILIASSATSVLFRSIIVASLKTKTLPAVAILSTIGKLVIATILVLVGTGVLGVTIGFTFFPVLTSVLLAIVIVRFFKRSEEKKPTISFSQAFRNILVASLVFWIPLLVSTIGSQLGTIVVFGSHGANQAGFYFIAFSIATGIATLMTVLSAIAYPTISAMDDGRKRVAWRVTKISLITSLPLTLSVLFYSKDIMRLFGQAYVDGSSSLEILLLSMFPTAVMGGITVLVYSYGNYRQVLEIGLATSIPRTVLYFIFVPIFGGTGAAITYTIGAMVGFIVSLIIAKKVDMHLFWKVLALLLIIPSGFGFASSFFGVNYILGILITLVGSYAVYAKLRIMDGQDLKDTLAILPSNLSNPANNLLNRLAKKL